MSLPADAVHLWLLDPSRPTRPDLLAAYDALMTEEERQRQRRFVFEKGRHEALCTRALVRTVLSRYADVPPSAWRFVQNAHGCPRIAPGLTSVPLRFNLSHTEGLIACAVVLDRDIGVDVERPARMTDAVSIADHYFSKLEYDALMRQPPEARHARFFRYWTLKEAYIKARERGLAIPLADFSFHLDGAGDPDASGPIRVSFAPSLSDDPSLWQFEEPKASPEHAIALGVRRGAGPDLTVVCRWTVPLED